MAIVPAKESRYYKLMCSWKREANEHRDCEAIHLGIPLVEMKDQAASRFFDTIKKYGPNAVVIE